MVRLIEYRQLANILSMFLIVQLAGLLLAFYLITPSQLQVYVGGEGAGDAGQVIIFFIYLIATAILMFYLFKTHRGPLLFRGIEAVVVVSASFYLFLIVLSSLFPADITNDTVFSLLAAIALIAAKNKWPGLRNLTAVIASVGVGVVLGIYFSFFAAFVLMALIAVYDYVAVFITKHMVTLGQESVNRNLAFMVGTYNLEVVPKGYLKAGEAAKMTRLFGRPVNEELRKLIKSGSVPMPSFSALGAGDLALPLMLSVSAYLTYLNYFFSLTIIAGASFGLVFAMYVSKKYAIALPAIPPLFAFSNIAVGLETLIISPANWQFYAPLLGASVIMLLAVFYTAKRESKTAGSKISPRRDVASRE